MPSRRFFVAFSTVCFICAKVCGLCQHIQIYCQRVINSNVSILLYNTHEGLYFVGALFHLSFASIFSSLAKTQCRKPSCYTVESELHGYLKCPEPEELQQSPLNKGGKQRGKLKGLVWVKKTAWTQSQTSISFVTREHWWQLGTDNASLSVPLHAVGKHLQQSGFTAQLSIVFILCSFNSLIRLDSLFF